MIVNRYNILQCSKFLDRQRMANSVDKDRSDLGLHYLLFHPYSLDALLYERTSYFEF